MICNKCYYNNDDNSMFCIKCGEKLKDTSTNVVNNIVNSNTLDIAFPLISSKKAWQYGGGGGDDVSTSGGSIDYTELFPAVRVKKIFEAIEDKYGISFVGNFLTDKRFT